MLFNEPPSRAQIGGFGCLGCAGCPRRLGGFLDALDVLDVLEAFSVLETLKVARALDAHMFILGSFRADMYCSSQDFIGNSEQQQTRSVANVAL